MNAEKFGYSVMQDFSYIALDMVCFCFLLSITMDESYLLGPHMVIVFI